MLGDIINTEQNSTPESSRPTIDVAANNQSRNSQTFGTLTFLTNIMGLNNIPL